MSPSMRGVKHVRLVADDEQAPPVAKVKRAVILPRDLALVKDAATLAARVSNLKSRGVHVIGPTLRTSQLGHSYVVAVSVLDLNEDPIAGDVYSDLTLMKPGELAFRGRTLQRMSLGLGLSWLPTSACTSSPAVKLVWQFRADASLLGYDGLPVTIQGTSEVDLRDGSPQIGGWSPSKWRLIARSDARVKKIRGWDELEVMKTRRFGLRLAETKAKSAAIRSLGLQGSYTAAELTQPFVLFRVLYLPDVSDPLIRMSVHEHAMRGTQQLYPMPFGGLRP